MNLQIIHFQEDVDPVFQGQPQGSKIVVGEQTITEYPKSQTLLRVRLASVAPLGMQETIEPDMEFATGTHNVRISHHNLNDRKLALEVRVGIVASCLIGLASINQAAATGNCGFALTKGFAPSHIGHGPQRQELGARQELELQMHIDL
jgi:hypothetical protein